MEFLPVCPWSLLAMLEMDTYQMIFGISRDQGEGALLPGRD